MKAVLLTTSCTTGWMHWGHGELWLTPEALVRIGKRELTVKAALGAAPGAALGVVAGPAGHVAALVTEGLSSGSDSVGREVELEQGQWEWDLMQRRKDVLSVPIRWISRAELKSGVSTTRLRIQTADGTRHKLLWMNNAVAKSALQAALGDRLYVT